MPEERRRTPRIRAYHPVRLQRPGTAPVVETLTKDLSSAGLRCLSSTWFPVTSDLHVELVLASGAAPITIRGKAAWFGMIPHSDQLELGISFQEIDPADKRRLSAYLDRVSASAPEAVQIL